MTSQPTPPPNVPLPQKQGFYKALLRETNGVNKLLLRWAISEGAPLQKVFIPRFRAAKIRLILHEQLI